MGREKPLVAAGRGRRQDRVADWTAGRKVGKILVVDHHMAAMDGQVVVAGLGRDHVLDQAFPNHLDSHSTGTLRLSTKFSSPPGGKS